MLNNSATLRPKSERPPPPPPISLLFLFGGGNSFFGMGDGARSGFFKEEAAQKKIQTKCKTQILYRAFVHHNIVSSLKGIPPRHPPREFPLGLRAPVLGMGTAQIPGK